MGINFPSSPAANQVFNVSPGLSFVYRNSKWVPAPLKTALPKNYIVNPTMFIGQQNGDTASGTTASGVYFLADQWPISWNNLAALALAVVRTRPSDTGNDYAAMSVVTGTPSLAADAYLNPSQLLEGQRVAEFQWGNARAQQAIFRFNFFTSVAGTYTMSVRNGLYDRTYLAPFTAPANSWNVYSFVIPGDTSGTWADTNAWGIVVGFCLACGSTYQGVAGWQAGNKLALPGITNGVATAGAGHSFTDVGFYLDPYKTGVAPPFELPIHSDELSRARRYWYRGYQFNGVVNAATGIRGGSRHPVPMRVAPAMTPRGSPRIYDISVTPIITSTSSANNPMVADLQLTTTAGGLTVGRAGANYFQSYEDYIEMSAR